MIPDTDAGPNTLLYSENKSLDVSGMEKDVGELSVCNVEETVTPSFSGPVFDQLPIEILHHIGGFLQPREIGYSLCGASSRLNQIFNTDGYWRVRIKRQWADSYPIIPDRVPKPSVWMHRCQDRETRCNLFKNADTKMEKRIFGVGEGGFVGGDVNAMCFCNDGKLLVTGGRDRYVIVWDLEAIKKTVDASTADSSALFQKVLHTHGGWVWSLRNNGNLVSSGAWDCKIAITDLNSTNSATPKVELKTTGSVTCHEWDNDQIIAGTFVGGLALFDPRKGREPVLQKSQSHHYAVLGVHMEGSRVVLVGTDKKIQLFDLRANDFIIKKTIPNNDYGTQLCVKEGNVWVGTKRGQVFLYDKEDFEFVEDLTAVVQHTNQITGLQGDSGHLLTCALDKTVKMRQPTKNADLIWQFQADAGFTAMDFSSQTCDLALAWGPVVGLWWPKRTG